MTKERISASVEPDVAEYLQRDTVNASGLINKLVKRHMQGGASENEIREFRKRQVQSEYEALLDQARRKAEEYQELERRGEETQSVPKEERAQLLEKVRRVPKETDHQLVQNVADELNKTPETVLEEAYQ